MRRLVSYALCGFLIPAIAGCGSSKDKYPAGSDLNRKATISVANAQGSQIALKVSKPSYNPSTSDVYKAWLRHDLKVQNLSNKEVYVPGQLDSPKASELLGADQILLVSNGCGIGNAVGQSQVPIVGCVGGLPASLKLKPHATLTLTQTYAYVGLTGMKPVTPGKYVWNLTIPWSFAGTDEHQSLKATITYDVK